MIHLLFNFFITVSYAGSEPPVTKYVAQKEMSGYVFDDFKDFEKNWKLVTVRYRKDTTEMRFTYVNDIGWPAVASGKSEYPEGTVFAKIGLISKEDPAFTSSQVPSGTRRYQFMVKDKKKHKETANWGYALFNSEKKTFPEDPKYSVRACAACHNLVADRDHVFSELMQLSPGESLWPPKSVFVKLVFETVEVSKLPLEVVKNLPSAVTQVRKLTGEISEHPFQGTLEEIIPSLSKESHDAKMPALLLNLEKNRFSIVYINELDKNCAHLNKIGMMSVATKMKSDSLDKKLNLILNQFCYDK